VNTQGKQVVGSSGNTGLSINEPLDSIVTAYNKCVSGAGDGIVLWSYGTTTAACSSYLTSALTWSKHGITVVGVCAPTFMAQRARVTNASTATSLASIITVSGNNNAFYNVAITNGGSNAAAINALTVSGERNYFYNCHVYLAHATPGALSTSSNLTCSAGLENTFERCVFGTDTVTRDNTGTATPDVILTSGTGRLLFKDCVFVNLGTSGQATHNGIYLGGAGDAITKTVYFDNCIWNYENAGAVSAQTSLLGGVLPNNGKIIFHNCGSLGYTAYDSAGTATLYVTNAAGAATGGVAAGG
jgi:hypothetical protein